MSAQTSRNGSGLKPVATWLTGTVRQAAAARGFASARVLTHWPEIVGEAVAARCRPVKITRGRGGAGGTLVLLTSGSNAPLLSMALPQILAKVNAACGHAAIARITLTQTAAEGFAPPPRPAPPAPTPAAHRAEAARLVASVGDGALKAALERLTLSFLAETGKVRS